MSLAERLAAEARARMLADEPFAFYYCDPGPEIVAAVREAQIVTTMWWLNLTRNEAISAMEGVEAFR